MRDARKATRLRRSAALAVAFATGIAGIAAARIVAQRGNSPALHADPLWPKPLPNHWILGSITGVAIDKRDHVWVVHRGQTPDSMAATEAGLTSNPVSAEICC